MSRPSKDHHHENDDDDDTFRFDNEQQQLAYSRLDRFRQNVYLSAYASASSVLELLKLDNSSRSTIASHVSMPPLIRDLLLLLHEYAPVLYEVVASKNPTNNKGRHMAAESYIRFMECLVGDFLAWRCGHLGVVPFLSELQHIGATPLAFGVGGGVVADNSPWSMPALEANSIEQLKQSMQQIWRAYQAVATTTAVAAAAVPFAVHHLVLKFEHGNNSFVFTDEHYIAEGFKLHSFGKWLQKKNKSARR